MTLNLLEKKQQRYFTSHKSQRNLVIFVLSHLYSELKQKKSKKPARYSFLPCSTNSFCLFLHLPRGKCNISCDTSTSLSAGRRPASIQLHRARQFFKGIHFVAFVPKGHDYLSAVDHSDHKTAELTRTPTSFPTNTSQNAQLSARFICLCSSTDSPRSLSTVHAQN